VCGPTFFMSQPGGDPAGNPPGAVPAKPTPNPARVFGHIRHREGVVGHWQPSRWQTSS